MVVNLDIGNLTSLGRHVTAVTTGRGVEDIPLAKVGKLLRATAKFDDPLAVAQAESLTHVSIRGGHFLTRGQVLEGGRAGGGGRGGDAHADLVAGLDEELGAVVHRGLRVPFVPGLDGAIAPGDNACLENGILARVSCALPWLVCLCFFNLFGSRLVMPFKLLCRLSKRRLWKSEKK